MPSLDKTALNDEDSAEYGCQSVPQSAPGQRSPGFFMLAFLDRSAQNLKVYLCCDVPSEVGSGDIPESLTQQRAHAQRGWSSALRLNYDDSQKDPSVFGGGSGSLLG